MLAANLKWLFSEWPLQERFGVAAACGFRAVELSLPYELPLPRVRELLSDHQLRFVYLLAGAGDWAAGERGLGCVPGRVREFRDGVALAIEYAAGLGRPFVHAAAGLRPEGADPIECTRLLHDNLRWACRQAAGHGLQVVLEPVCRRDYPRYSVPNLAAAQAVLAEVGAANLGLVLDLHHVQWEEGHAAADVHRTLAAAGSRLWHVQLALAPDRLGPDASDYDAAGTLAYLARLGYAGAVSCEYRPAVHTLASLAWAQPHGIRVPAQLLETPA